MKRANKLSRIAHQDHWHRINKEQSLKVKSPCRYRTMMRVYKEKRTDFAPLKQSFDFEILENLRDVQVVENLGRRRMV